jgi:hypothetical protein
MWRRVTLRGTDVSEERIASISVTRINELGTTLAVTSNWGTLLTFLGRRFLWPWWWRWYVPPKHMFLQEPNGVTFQMTAFFLGSLMFEAFDIAVTGDGQHEIVHYVVFHGTRVVICRSTMYTSRARSIHSNNCVLWEITLCRPQKSRALSQMNNRHQLYRRTVSQERS